MFFTYQGRNDKKSLGPIAVVGIGLKHLKILAFVRIRGEGRPCGFGQSLVRPIVRSISNFFCLAKKNCPVSETGQFIFCPV